MSGHQCLICEAACVIFAATAFAAPPPVPLPLNEGRNYIAQPEPPKEATVQLTISALRQEAMDAWREGWIWPREEADFAADMNWTLPREDVVAALTRRLSRNAAIDGYIKWQLLSFMPDLAELDRATINRIAAHLPDPLRPAEPKFERPSRGGGVSLSIGTQRAYVRDVDPVISDGAVAYDPDIGIVGSGVYMSMGEPGEYRRQVAGLRLANRRLDDARVRVNRANRSIHAYREALLRAAPAEPDLRLGLLLKDVRDRLLAGDPTVRGAMDRLLESAEAAATNEALPSRDRRTLIRWARALGKMSGSIVRGVELDRRGEPRYDREKITLREEDVDRLVEHLRAIPLQR